MTLQDYLATLTVGGASLIWSDVPLSNAEVQLAGDHPYLRVSERDAFVAEPMYGNRDIFHQLVDLNFYQAPASTTGDVPSDKDEMMELLYQLLDAPQNVDEWDYNMPLIELSRVVLFRPDFDPDTRGLMGLVRFRATYAVGPA